MQLKDGLKHHPFLSGKLAAMTKNQRYVLEHFEDQTWAVLEDPNEKCVVIPRAWLPEHSREGDMLRVMVLDEDSPGRNADASLVVFEIQQEETKRTLERLEKLRTSLPQAAEGDIEL